jgi:multidrug resistance efflux pump
MARKLNVKGTKDFLIAAIVLGLLGLWAIRDGWFPPESILKKYPLSVDVSFDMPGVVETVNVEPGVKVSEQMPVVHFTADADREQYAQALSEAEVLKKEIDDLERKSLDAAGDEMAELTRRIESAQEALDTARKRVENANKLLGARPLHGGSDGRVTEVLVDSGDVVEDGTVALRIKPNFSFYPFNKILAVLSLLGAAVCAVIHFVVK